MTILQKLKSILGFGDSDAEQSSRDVGVTVERKRAETPADRPGDTKSNDRSVDAESDGRGEDATEDRSKSTDADAGGTEGESTVSPDATETGEDEIEDRQNADDEIVHKVSDHDVSDRKEPEHEVSVRNEVEDEEVEDEEVEDEEVEDEVAPDEEVEDEETDHEPVNVIKGIGPAYADRLAAEGVETVADLAESDAETLSAGTDISPKRIQGWIDRAKVR